MKQLWAPWRMEYILNEVDKHDGCIFCELPAEKDDPKNLILYRTAYCFVILNKYPYNNGHLMVVPYKHTGNLLDLSDDILLDIQQTIRKVIEVMNHILHPQAMNIGMNIGRTAGAGIADHIHYHIVPRWDGDTNFMPVIAGTKIVSESLRTTWKKMHDEFVRLYG